MKTFHLMNKLADSLLILIFLFILTACTQSQAKSPKEISIQWSEIEQGVGLEVGDILEVVLPAKPSTGYLWEAGFYNQSVLKPYGEPEFSSTSTNTNLGAEETQTLHMEAIGEGESELVLVYHRPFENEGADQQTFKINVVVK